MLKDKIVILGTGRADSNTHDAILKVNDFNSAKIVELHKLKIEKYTYKISPSIQRDDFISIVNQMIIATDILFATPVYWYSMSGELKIFFDRLTDLITTNKPLGRALTGKNIYLLATGSDPQLPEGFEIPFVKTAEYFECNFIRSYYFNYK